MARRNRGIFERKNREGFWYRDYRNGGDVWKRMGETRREANRALDRLLALSAPPARITVAQAVERWLASAVATRRNPRFARGTATAAELHLLPALGMRPLAMVTKDDVRAYRLTLEAKKLSPQSVKNLLSDLRAVLWWAVDVDLLDRTPFPRRVMPRVQETAPDPFTADEWKALVKVGGAHGFAVRFLVGTGLRFGEGSRAQAAHVARGMLVVSQTKSGRVRRIPLAPALLEEVRGRVGRLVPFTASGSFNRTVRRLSGVTLFHAHRCRDTFACRLLEGGASLATVQELLGHQSVTTTQRYARLSDGAVVRETERSWG